MDGALIISTSSNLLLVVLKHISTLSDCSISSCDLFPKRLHPPRFNRPQRSKLEANTRHEQYTRIDPLGFFEKAEKCSLLQLGSRIPFGSTLSKIVSSVLLFLSCFEMG